MENKKPEELIVKTDLVVKVIEYLLKRPMFEVMYLVKALETEPIPYEKPEEEAKK